MCDVDFRRLTLPGLLGFERGVFDLDTIKGSKL
jgi:hypothetical protein